MEWVTPAKENQIGEFQLTSLLTTPLLITMANGDKALDTWVLIPMFILAIVMLLIAIQFDERTANAYAYLITITFAFYAISLARGFAGWQGLGPKKDMGKNVALGAGIFVFTLALGTVIGVPFAIGTSVVLNLFYRWFSAVMIEEPLFRGIIQPTFKKAFGNAFSAALVSSIAWAGFHIVALQGNASQIVVLVIVGVVYAMVNEYAKSLMPSLVAHGLWNLKQVLAI